MSDNKAIRSGIWFTASNFLVKGIGFITTPVFTRMLTRAEYGDFSNFTNWTFIILYVTSLNLESSLIRATHEFRDDFDRYVFSMIALSAASTLIWWGAFALFIDRASALLSMDKTYIHCMFVYLLFFPAVNIFQNAERFRYRYKVTVATSLAISVGASLLSVALVLTLRDRLFGRTLGYILPVGAIGLGLWVWYAARARRVVTRYWRYALPIALPFIPHLLSMFMLNKVDQLMIKRICGSEALALYSLAYTVGMIVTMLVSSINAAFSPWLAEKLAAGDYAATRRASAPYAALFSAVAIAAVLVTPELLYIMGGEPYMAARYVVPPVAAGCLVQFIYCMYVNIEQYEKKTGGMAVASMAAAAINYALNALFIPKYGYVAAAYTTFVGYAALLAAHMLLVRRLGLMKVYDNRRLALVAIAASALIFGMNAILDHWVIRYILLAAMGAVMLTLGWRYRAVILSKLKRR